MKKIFIAVALLLAIKAHTQMYAEFAAGISTTKSPVISPSLGVYINNVVLQAQMVALTARDQPAYFGIHAGYNFLINDDIKIQPSIGSCYELYSTDKYDVNKNHWRFMYSCKAYYKKVFVQYQAADIKIFSIGITTFFNGNN